ncbi:hypothetical protein HLK59_11805 [Streptomyces sp. S3(2020)]|uniref:hypothetical protein n=1 Tax=Streptomyces sp. S3(2020) TaxID=2732044 RepID=UPI0014893925|nr:hypothetical protein [Streptomyces sp. S3(2020)]NNN31044.1 hypothetical protein [Streptomyces sp. S3(2020)]
MVDPRLRGVPAPPSESTAPGRDGPGQAGVVGIGLAAVLTFALAQGSWEWFAAYIGATLLAVIFAFCRPPTLMPGPRSAYVGSLTAYSMVVGLCAAIALAPALQRWPWLFPMPGTRAGCPELGRYQSIRAQAEMASLGGLDRAAFAYLRDAQSHAAVADCLAATTTRWLPVYGGGAAVVTRLAVWCLDRARRSRRAATAGRVPSR